MQLRILFILATLTYSSFSFAIEPTMLFLMAAVATAGGSASYYIWWRPIETSSAFISPGVTETNEIEPATFARPYVDLRQDLAVEFEYADAAKRSGKSVPLVVEDTPLGRTRAAFFGSLNGDYWNVERIVSITTTTQIKSNDYWQSGDYELIPMQASIWLRDNATSLSSFNPKSNAVHFHVTDGEDSISSSEKIAIEGRWRKKYGKNLAAVITLRPTRQPSRDRYRFDVGDMRKLFNADRTGVVNIGYTYNCSVSVDGPAEMAFDTGRTFRRHGRFTRITHFALVHGDAIEVGMSNTPNLPKPTNPNEG